MMTLQVRLSAPMLREPDLLIQSLDEADQISTRSLALTRYKRNHELMNEVFQYAAFGDPTKRVPKAKSEEDTKIATPYSIFDRTDLEEKKVHDQIFQNLQTAPLSPIWQAKLEAEIATLKAHADERQSKREQDTLRARGGIAAADMTMEGIAAS